MTQTQARPKKSDSGKVPSYRIICNWDGAPLIYAGYPQTAEMLLEKTFGPIRNTQVDALFFSLGIHEATWPTKIVEMIGDSSDRKYDAVLKRNISETVREYWERGENPYAAIADHGHGLGMHVYPSIRMNDQHFWTYQTIEAMLKSKGERFTKMRLDHPEWCLSEKHAPGWCATSWNMAIPEVRDFKLKFIEEACRIADWDGVELDWQRHAFHLPWGDEYRLRYTLTDLMRTMRDMTNKLGKERGRPFRLAVRVAATLESCNRIGYDIETWAKEGLCDIIIGGGNSGTDPGFEVERSAELCQGRDIKLYPCWDFDGRQATDRLVKGKDWRTAWFRALAQEFHSRGASGIYVFNWHGYTDTNQALFTTMGSPVTLKGTRKCYSNVHRMIPPRGSQRDYADRDDRIYGETPVELHRTLTGDGPTFQVPMYDDVPTAAKAGTLAGAELHIRMEHFSPGADVVSATLDGKDLGAYTVTNKAAQDPGNPSDVDENSWLVWKLDPKLLAVGTREVQVKLVKRDERITPPLTISHVDIWVDYK